jgi:hypothetical protein
MKNSLAQRKARVLNVMSQAQSGEIRVLLAVRQVQVILGTLDKVKKRPQSADLLFLTRVSSESDEWPLGSERQYWAPALLLAKDEEIDRYEAKVRDKVLLAIARISDELNDCNNLP